MLATSQMSKSTRKGNTQWRRQSYGGVWYSWISRPAVLHWFEVCFNLSGIRFSCMCRSRNTCKNSDSPPPAWKAAFCSPTSGVSASGSNLNKVFGPGLPWLLATLVQPRVRTQQLSRLVYNKATDHWRSEVEEAFDATSASLFGLMFKRRSSAAQPGAEELSCVLCNITDQLLVTCVYYRHTLSPEMPL